MTRIIRSCLCVSLTAFPSFQASAEGGNFEVVRFMAAAVGLGIFACLWLLQRGDTSHFGDTLPPDEA